MIEQKQIKERRNEALLSKLINDFLNSSKNWKNIVINDVMLSKGGHDLKVFVNFEVDSAQEEIEKQIKKLNSGLAVELRGWIAKRWEQKMVPRLQFVVDKGAINEKIINKILADLKKQQ